MEYQVTKVYNWLMVKKTTKSTKNQQPESFIEAFNAVLTPLVRLLLTRGITFPTLNKWLKAQYVQIALSEFTLEDRPQTDSRIHLLTGIHRQEVKRLRENKSSKNKQPESVSLGALLVSRWTGSKKFLNSQGNPRPLPRLANNRHKICFEDLVRTENTDIRPRVVLDEWMRLGIVSLDEKDYVHLNTDAFVPESGFDELAHYFARNLYDHISAAASNLAGKEKRYLERSVYYDQLSEESVKELEKLAEKLGMEALQGVNRRAYELQQKDIKDGKTEHRINFGVYCFNEKQNKD